MKKLIILMLALMLFLSNGICVFAKEENIMARKAWIKKIDKVLENANVPESVIREMDDEFKEFIYENSGANIEYVKVKKATGGKENLLRSGGYEISESDLELKVVAFKVGNKQVDIYPSYEWKKAVKPRGKDYFGYSTHPDFSAVPKQRSNKAWYRLLESHAWESQSSLAYTGSHLTGYEHKGGTLGTPDFPIYIKCYAFFRADIDKINPVKKIEIAYVHDTTWGSNFGYSVGYGPASISITPSGGDVGYMNGIYNLEF